MMRNKRLCLLMIILVFMLMLSACSSQIPSIPVVDNGQPIYYLNPAKTGIVSETFIPRSQGDVTVEDVLEALTNVPSEGEYVAPLKDLPVEVVSNSDGDVQLSFTIEYMILSNVEEVLVRAAVVKSLCALEDVRRVAFLVGREPITDEYGGNVGYMRDSDFVEYFGKEQGKLLSENLTIYYANADGTKLIKETRRVFFEPSKSLEQAVIANLSEMPNFRGAQIAVPENFSVSNIATTEGICYVDLDMSFLTQTPHIAGDVTIYALVNSLCELENVQEVQLNLSSADNSATTEAQELSGLYQKNLELVENP